MKKILPSFILLILYLPIAGIIIASFISSENGFTITYYKSLFQNKDLLKALFNTLFIASCTTLLSLILGTLAAISVEFNKSKLKDFLRNSFSLIVFTPDMALALSLGMLYSFLQVEKSQYTVILSQSVSGLGICYFFIRVGLSMLEKNLINAGFDCGATPTEVISNIILPQIIPSIITSSLMVFILSFTDLSYSLFTSGVGGTTLTTYLYSSLRFKFSHEIYSAFAIFFICFFILIIVSYYFHNRQTRRVGV